ncbi:prepilin-type N-terminal cleavage/methylation domain-containing protein [Elusimicrobium simillimum]|uniref:type IV pilin protein n=1 Tax=Elusimicrobium simillimum TaxID=3143438 RepID=UPI003C6FF7EB
MSKGFTLIELLVVVLIIGILSAIALPQYTKAVAKSRASEAYLLGKAFLQAEQIYFLSNNVYTSNAEDLDIEMSGATSTAGDDSSGTYGKVTLKNFSISLRPLEDGVVVVQSVGGTKPQSFEYEIVYDKSSKMFCRAPAADTKSQGMCTALGAKSTGRGTTWLEFTF